MDYELSFILRSVRKLLFQNVASVNIYSTKFAFPSQNNDKKATTLPDWSEIVKSLKWNAVQFFPRLAINAKLMWILKGEFVRCHFSCLCVIHFFKRQKSLEMKQRYDFLITLTKESSRITVSGLLPNILIGKLNVWCLLDDSF